jgi:hypothetical protein
MVEAEHARKARKENVMKHRIVSENRTTRRILPMAGAAALAVAFTVSMPLAAHADEAEHITPPAVPGNLKVADGSKAFLVGHATGTQNYICLPSGTGFAYALFTPEATLFNDHFKQLITHFFSVNPKPADNGAIRATWQHSRDTSTIWAKVAVDGISTDEHFVQRGAVAWLLLDVVGTQEGPAGGDTLTVTTQVQRLNTSGGAAPSTGCAALTDVGTKAFVPYTADYFFYRIPSADGDDDDGN